jgi:predicted deacetylase
MTGESPGSYVQAAMLHEPITGIAGSDFPAPGRQTPYGGPFLIVCFGNLAPHTQRACQEFLPQLAQAGVPRVSLMLVPRCPKIEPLPYFGRWVRSLAEAGHEICLHGEAGETLQEGSSRCAQLGVAVSGFAPPPGRHPALAALSRETREALAAQGFAYVVTAGGIDLLPSGRRLETPAVPLAAGSSWQIPAACLRARFLCSARRGAAILRLDVEPSALYQPALRHTLLTAVREALATRKSATCGELAARAAAS